MPHTAIAFDFGTKRIGVAVCSDVTRAYCDELDALSAREGIPNWHAIEALLSEWQPRVLLVGLPLKSDGSDMEITRRARKFGNRLHGRFRLPVEFIEETLSTREAKEEAFQRGHRGSFARRPVDSIAARLILESWIRERN